MRLSASMRHLRSIGSWICTIREVSRREQAGCHGVREPRLAPVRMLFPGNRRKLSRKGRVSHRMLGFTPGFFAHFDCTPESAHHMARCLLVTWVCALGVFNLSKRC